MMIVIDSAAMLQASSSEFEMTPPMDPSSLYGYPTAGELDSAAVAAVAAVVAAAAPLDGAVDIDKAGGDESPSIVESSPAAKSKRARTSKPKVKTGCKQCKQRRVKCDETRPACTRCVKGDRECTGYPPIPRPKTYGEIKILPKPVSPTAPSPSPLCPPAMIMAAPACRSIQPRRNHKIKKRAAAAATAGAPVPVQTATPVIQEAATPPERLQSPPPSGDQAFLALYLPVSGLPFGHVEGLYFEIFQSHTASELSGYFDDVFWTRMVLQQCNSEPAIRHAVVALGALYKTLEQNSESPPSSPSEMGSPPSTGRAATSRAAFDHWQVAIRQYSRACKALMPGTDPEQQQQQQRRQPSGQVMLMGAVLLACFDSFAGDHKQAIHQIQNGLTLLENLRQLHRSECGSSFPDQEEPVEQELIQMFNRLAIQAKSYDMAFHFPKPYVVRLTPAAGGGDRGGDRAGSHSPLSDPSSLGMFAAALHIPTPFVSLREARLVWDRLCERLLRFTETLLDSDNPNAPTGVAPHRLLHVGMGFRAQLEAWVQSFNPLLAARTAPDMSWQERAGIAVLKMFQVMGYVLFMMTFSDSELAFDGFQSEFQCIVDLAVEVVGDEEWRAAAARCPEGGRCAHRERLRAAWAGSGPAPLPGGEHMYGTCHIKPSFSADLGIVPPLYVVATKCRDPMIRRQAIQLLRSSPRREGMWDSELTARIGTWVAEIEEEGNLMDGYGMNGDGWAAAAGYAHVPLPEGAVMRGRGGVVPAEKRVMVRSVDFNLQKRQAQLKVGTRGISPLAADEKKRETSISW